MAFKFNERVRVTKLSTEYDGKYRGMVGVVKYPYDYEYTGRYGIEFNGFRNTNTKMGLFWFDEKHLISDEKVEEMRNSIKETQDALDGKEKADMTRAKTLKSLFRIVTPQFTLKEIIRQTIFSISDNDNNKLMTGELVEINEN